MPALLQLEQIQVGGQVKSQGVSGKGGENMPALLQLEQIQVGGQMKSQGVSGRRGERVGGEWASPVKLEQIQVGGQVKSLGVSGKGGGGERICQLCYSWNRFR